MSKVKYYDDFTESLKAYIPFIKSRVIIYCDNQSNFDDYFQEGMLGLLEAINAYDSSKNAAFLTFAKVCIDNRLKNCKRTVSKGNRLKVSNLDEITTENSAADIDSPESIVIAKDEITALKQKAKLHLSKLEYTVFCYHICGYSYFEISKKMGIEEKSVDNAIQRIKRKLKNKFA